MQTIYNKYTQNIYIYIYIPKILKLHTLYSNILTTSTINGTGFTAYIAGTTGTINRLYYQDSNIAQK